MNIGTMSRQTYYYLDNSGHFVPTNNIGDFFTRELKVFGISGLAPMGENLKLEILRGIFGACFNKNYRIMGWALGDLSDVFYYKKLEPYDLFGYK